VDLEEVGIFGLGEVEEEAPGGLGKEGDRLDGNGVRAAFIDVFLEHHVLQQHGALVFAVHPFAQEGVFFEDLSGEVLQDDELARLLSFPNVLITAHQAFLTHEALSEISRVTVENLRRFASGQPFLEGTAV
jgi:D-lactate dehydrogenase